MALAKTQKKHSVLVRVCMFALAILVAFCCVIGSSYAQEFSREIFEEKNNKALAELGDFFISENGDADKSIGYNIRVDQIVHLGQGGYKIGIAGATGYLDSDLFWSEGGGEPPLDDNGNWRDGSPPTITSSLWGMISNIGDTFRFWLANGIAQNYAGLLDDAIDSAEDAEKLLSMNIDGTSSAAEDLSSDQYNTNWTSLYELAYSVCKNIILPVGIVVLAFILAMEIYQLVCERNNMNDLGAGQFIQLFIRFIIAIVVLVYSWELATFFFNFASALVADVVAIPMEDGETNLTTDQWEFVYWFYICIDKRLTFGALIGAFIESWLISIIMTIMSLIMWVLIYIRLIEIYFMIAAAPIPLATLTNREWGQMGRNYLKSLAALAFQAVLIMMACMMFVALIYGSVGISTSSDGPPIGSTDLFGNAWGVMGYAVILIFVLMKTGSISKSIFDAH